MIPLIYHDNGPKKLRFRPFSSIYARHLSRKLFHDKALKNKYKKPDNLDILICHNYKEKPITVRSLEYMGIHDYVVLGGDLRPWENRKKIDLVLNYVRDQSKAEYILFLDAADVMVHGNLEEVVSRFQNDFDCGILFNGEKQSYPSPSFYPDRKLSPEEKIKIDSIEEMEKATYQAPFHHLNSGCYIAKREAILEYFSEAIRLHGFIEAYKKDDQVLMRELHRQYYPKIQIDHNRKVFQCFHLCDKEEATTPYSYEDIESKAFFFYWWVIDTLFLIWNKIKKLFR